MASDLFFLGIGKGELSDILSLGSLPIACPTIFFIEPDHLNALTSSILEHAKSNVVLHTFALRHKLAALNEGFVTKEGLWDRLVFDNARTKVMGDMAGTLRAVVVSGGMHSFFTSKFLYLSSRMWCVYVRVHV